MKCFLLLGYLWLAFAPAVFSQEDVVAPPATEKGSSIELLRSLAPALVEAETYLADLRDRAESVESTDDKVELAKQIEVQRERVAGLRENFRTLATGIEDDRYFSMTEEPSSWQENLEDIIAPISSGIRELTSGPREMEELREELAVWSERMELAGSALRRIDKLSEVAEQELIEQELTDTRKLWASRNAEAVSRVQVFKQQLDEREASSPSTWELVSSSIAEFWKNKGLNLVIALFTAVVVFFLIRKAYEQFKRVSPVHRKGQGFAVRGADLVAAGLAGVLAFGSAVLVFYLRGDWLLLSLAVILVIGILWASKRAIPPFIDQIKMILNIGSVRQGERLVYDGIPWRADKINFFCEFSNPDLTGGSLRLPVREVMSLHSRIADPKEPWFPTRCDDWVKLADETYGKVVQQTPEQVVVLRLGSSRKTYPTSEFLEQCPENLSHGFRVSAVFGIDYEHQAISTSQVPPIFQVALERELVSTFGHESVRSVKVEFASAGASSLDYEIIADFAGGVASRVNVIRRLTQKVCVDVCNEHRWGIPFAQITVHQAEGAPADAGR